MKYDWKLAENHRASIALGFRPQDFQNIQLELEAATLGQPQAGLQ